MKRVLSDDPGRHRQRWKTLLVLLTVMGLMIGMLATSRMSARAASSLPCDIYASSSTPCIAAHSTVRALFSAYNGPLYQIQRASDNHTLDIGLLAAGGYANAAPQVSFCSGTRCTITKLYDQSANHNDLPISSGGFWKGPGPNGSDIGADAMALPVTVAGHQVFGIKVTPGVGYRIDNAKGAPVGSQPEGIYMVTSSNDVNNQCCFDYGSGETSHTDTGNATMNAIYWGTACWFGTFGNNPCVGTGPWVEADLENGMYHTNTGSNKDPNNPGVHFPFVSAWEKNNGTNNFTLKYGNAQSGGLARPYSGPLPNGYSPMKLQPSILLGTGGDNSNGDVGEFFEGAVTAGFPADATEDAVQANIVSAGYGSSVGSTPTPIPTTGTTPTPTPTPITGGACKVTYTVTNQWQGGFGANISITNTSSTAWSSWTLKFTFPGSQQVTQLWNGNVTQSGSSVTVTNASYNGQVPAGAAISPGPGFNGSWNGSNPNPTSFTVNGATCTTS